jgi:hypothetical protein
MKFGILSKRLYFTLFLKMKREISLPYLSFSSLLFQGEVTVMFLPTVCLIVALNFSCDFRSLPFGPGGDEVFLFVPVSKTVQPAGGRAPG